MDQHPNHLAVVHQQPNRLVLGFHHAGRAWEIDVTTDLHSDGGITAEITRDGEVCTRADFGWFDKHENEAAAAPRYEVQHHTICQGWINTWSVRDGATASLHERQDDQPQTFASRAEAEAALAEFLAEIAADIASGERAAENGYEMEDFRIVAVTT